MARPAFRFMTVSRLFFIRLEPIRAFPAHLFTEGTSEITESEVSGGDTHVAPRDTFFTGEVDVIILCVCFKCTRRSVIQAVVVGAKAPYIEPPHIPFGVAVHDPFCHNFADTACAGEAMRAERTCHPETLNGGGSEQKFTIRCKAFRTIQQFDNFRVFNGRHAPYGIFHQWCESFPARQKAPRPKAELRPARPALRRQC